jgi:hypothetical protein
LLSIIHHAMPNHGSSTIALYRTYKATSSLTPKDQSPIFGFLRVWIGSQSFKNMNEFLKF